MDAYKLSEMYALATKRMTAAMAQMYEDLHDEEGDPLETLEAVERAIADAKKQIQLEVDLIKQAVIEFQETRVP